MKKKKTVTTILYIIVFCIYILSVIGFIGKNTDMGIQCLRIASFLLLMGTALINIVSKLKEKKKQKETD